VQQTATGSADGTKQGSTPMASRASQSSGPQIPAAAQQPLVRQSTMSFLSGFWARGAGDETVVNDMRCSLTVPGLKVRMGVATGQLPQGTAITRCALFQLAKGLWREECTEGSPLSTTFCIFYYSICIIKRKLLRLLLIGPVSRNACMLACINSWLGSSHIMDDSNSAPPASAHPPGIAHHSITYCPCLQSQFLPIKQKMFPVHEL